MRRVRLNDPTPRPRRPARSRDGVHHAVLAAPIGALPKARRLLDPVSGKVRRLERAVNLWLSRRLFPRIPLLRGTYDRTLLDRLEVSEAELTLPGLEAGMDGCRVLLVSDVHAGVFVSRGALERVFARFSDLRADLVLLGGDLVNGRPEELDDVLPAIDRLEAPLGVFAVVGNHDRYAMGVGRLEAALDACGVRLLVNRHVTVSRNGSRFVLAGIDDWITGRPDVEAALDGAGGDGPIVLLSHNPDVAFEAEAHGVALVLSGHTHAGQIRVPGLPVLVRMSRYRLDEGRYRTAGGTEVVVSRGLGVVGVPVRLACPPEVVLLTLRARANRPP